MYTTTTTTSEKRPQRQQGAASEEETKKAKKPSLLSKPSLASKNDLSEESRSDSSHSDEEQFIEQSIESSRLEDERRRQAARDYLASLRDSTSLGGKLSTSTTPTTTPMTKTSSLPTAITEDDDDSEVDAAKIDRENIAARLKQDILQSQGKVFKRVAMTEWAPRVATTTTTSSFPTPSSIIKMDHVPTAVAVWKNHIFATSKRSLVQEWIVERALQVVRKGRTFTAAGIKGPLLCLAISEDGRYLVSGGHDHRINVWDLSLNGEERETSGMSGCLDNNNSNTESNKDTNPNPDNAHRGQLTQHRGPITGVAFQLGTHTLFSSSTDRTIKLWNVADMAYIDTLFGHQDEVLAVDALNAERCLTVGARDRTVRLWKVPEESQLVFRGSEGAGGSLDVVTFVDGEHFVSGSDAGVLSLWGTHRKKPLHNFSASGHSVDANADADASADASASSNASASGLARGVTCLHSLRLTDFLISGHGDGLVAFWAINTESYDDVSLLGSVQLAGCINGIALNEDDRMLVVAVGREARLGRWSVNKQAKNSLVVYHL